nr:hypothetical protein KPHV_63190 [Kitasatospora purpeofusca]
MRSPADGRPLPAAYHLRLIVAESTTVAPQAVGYPSTPCLHTDVYAASRRRLTGAVHEEGVRIIVQLQHCGRISRPDLLDGQAPGAPSVQGVYRRCAPNTPLATSRLRIAGATHAFYAHLTTKIGIPASCRHFNLWVSSR